MLLTTAKNPDPVFQGDFHRASDSPITEVSYPPLTPAVSNLNKEHGLGGDSG
jgi:hypothetical protein